MMARKIKKIKSALGKRTVKGPLMDQPASANWGWLGFATPFAVMPALGPLFPSVYALLLSAAMDYPVGSAGNSFVNGLRWGGWVGLGVTLLLMAGAFLFLNNLKPGPTTPQTPVTSGLKTVFGRLFGKKDQTPDTVGGCCSEAWTPYWNTVKPY